MSEYPGITPQQLEALFAAIFEGPEEALPATINTWFNPEYVQVTYRQNSSFDEFVAHLRKLRSVISHASVKVVFLIREGHEIADCHIMTIEKYDESIAVLEVLPIGERDEHGKLLRVWEAVMTVQGDKASAELGRAR